MDHPRATGGEKPAAAGAGIDKILDTGHTGVLPTDQELGGATCMGTRASGAVAPISHEGLNAHQQRVLRNLGLLTSPMASDAEEYSARERKHD